MLKPLLAILAAALLVGCGSDGNPGATTDDVVPPLHPSVDDYGETLLEIEGTELAVLVADSPDERHHGLMEVEELPDGVGMVFVYTEDRKGGFHMANTHVPLSIAFVDADATVVEILHMEPCPSGEGCPSYRPADPYRYAIEVPQSWYDRAGIEIGAHVGGLPDRSD